MQGNTPVPALNAGYRTIIEYPVLGQTVAPVQVQQRIETPRWLPVEHKQQEDISSKLQRLQPAMISQYMPTKMYQQAGGMETDGRVSRYSQKMMRDESNGRIAYVSQYRPNPINHLHGTSPYYY